MFHHFSAHTADELWLQVAAAFRDEGTGWTAQASRNGPTRELLHATLSVQDPTQRWITSRRPPINPAFALAEVIWVLCGRNDSAFLNYFNGELPKYAGTGDTYHGAYGFRMRKHFGIDQLERAHRVLEARPDDRQVILQIWDCRIDLADEDLKARSLDIPCNALSLLKVRAGALEWTQILRSNDVFRGLPYDIVQFTTLQEVMAGWLGVRVGSYNQVSDSLHVYESDLGKALSAKAGAALKNTDTLALSPRNSEQALCELSRVMGSVIHNDTVPSELIRLLEVTSLPRAHRNMLCVLIAESARRRRDLNVAAAAIAVCTNPSLRQLWDQWADHLRSKTDSR